MSAFKTIVIGASAGGVEALKRIVSNLPSDLPAAIFVVVHFPTDSMSMLPQILARSGQLPIAHAIDGDRIQPGHVYIAPPNKHMTLGDGIIHVQYGPRVNALRPAIDSLFLSAAKTYGASTIGVILSGTMEDGIDGLAQIKSSGGITIVQDPEEAIFSVLPVNAIKNIEVDYILTSDEIAFKLTELIQRTSEISKQVSMAGQSKSENEFVQQDIHSFEQGEGHSARTVLTCPECGGVLWELHEGQVVRYLCHVGHEFSEDSMLLEQTQELENALWVAVRALEERAALLRRLAGFSHERGNNLVENRFQKLAVESENNANIVRSVIVSGKATGMSEPGSEELYGGGNNFTREN